MLARPFPALLSYNAQKVPMSITKNLYASVYKVLMEVEPEHMMHVMNSNELITRLKPHLNGKVEERIREIMARIVENMGKFRKDDGGFSTRRGQCHPSTNKVLLGIEESDLKAT